MESTISVRLWHKTCGEPRTYVSGTFDVVLLKIINFCAKATLRKTVPTVSAQHILSKQMESLSEIWSTACPFLQIVDNRSADFEQRNGRNTHFHIAWHIFGKTCQFLRNWMGFDGIDNFRSTLAQNMRGAPYTCFRDVRTWYQWKSKFSVHQSTGKKTLPAGLAPHVALRACAIAVDNSAQWSSLFVTLHETRTYGICTHKWILNITFRETSHFVASP